MVHNTHGIFVFLTKKNNNLDSNVQLSQQKKYEDSRQQQSSQSCQMYTHLITQPPQLKTGVHEVFSRCFLLLMEIYITFVHSLPTWVQLLEALIDFQSFKFIDQQQGILGNPPQAALNSISNRRNDTDRRRIDRNREREERERERMREQQERDSRDRKRERDHREQERKEKEREKERDRSPVKRRSRSPRRSPKRARKSAPRYVVQVPRFPLDMWVFYHRCVCISFSSAAGVI